MANMDTSGLDELIRDMQRMGEDASEVAQAMVREAASVIRDAWKESAEKHGLIDTGAMIESIGYPGPVARIGDALYRDVYPLGKDRKGTRNAEKAFVLNYGTSRILPTYWVDEAEDAAAPRVQERLEKIWNDYLETGKIPVTADGGSAGGINKVTK